MSEVKAQRFLAWFYSLPRILRPIGVGDKYHKGRCVKIDFRGECDTVWIQYKTYCKAYRG